MQLARARNGGASSVRIVESEGMDHGFTRRDPVQAGFHEIGGLQGAGFYLAGCLGRGQAIQFIGHGGISWPGTSPARHFT